MIPIISLVIWLVLIGVALYLLEMIPMEGTIKQVIKVVVIVVVIIAVLQAIRLLGPINNLGIK